jgi:hypothetical protein
MHTRHRLGAANTDSAYYTFWQQILGDTEAPSATPTSRREQSRTRSDAQSLSIGMVSWNNKLALRYKFSDTDKCPLCQTDGGGHIASGCQDPIMKRMYTERHNKAGRILLDAIYNGARGSDICMADVGSQQRCEDDGRPTSPQPCARRDAPRRPTKNRGARPVAAHQAARHHALQHARTLAGRQSAARHLHRGAQDPRHAPTDQLTAARLQHEELVERLVQRGYQRQDQDLPHPTRRQRHHLRGAHDHTRKQLGCSGMLPLSCARKLHTLMVQQLHSSHHPAAPRAQSRPWLTPTPPLFHGS